MDSNLCKAKSNGSRDIIIVLIIIVTQARIFYLNIEKAIPDNDSSTSSDDKNEKTEDKKKKSQGKSDEKTSKQDEVQLNFSRLEKIY